jgi:hypothetical protein
MLLTPDSSVHRTLKGKDFFGTDLTLLDPYVRAVQMSPDLLRFLLRSIATPRINKRQNSINRARTDPDEQTSHIVYPSHRLVEGATPNTVGAADTGHPPEGQAGIGIDIPFHHARVVGRRRPKTRHLAL